MKFSALVTFCFLPLIGLGSMVAACGGGEGQSLVVGTKGENLACQANGIHIDGCPIVNPPPPPPPPPPKSCLAEGQNDVCGANGISYWNPCYATQAGVTSWVSGACNSCLVNPLGSASLKSTAGFDPLLLNPNAGAPVYDATYFPQALANAHCGQERHYDVGLDNIGYSWATAVCSKDFALPAVDAANGTAGEIPCDSWTGTPNADQVVVAWLVSGPCWLLPNGTVECIEPTGCEIVDCLAREQAYAASGMTSEDAGVEDASP